MKNVEDFVLYPKEFSVYALERAYQKFKDRNPLPAGITFSLGDNDGEYTFLWGDIEILHHLPTYLAKSKYYNWLIAREDCIKGILTPGYAANYLLERIFRQQKHFGEN